jgi:hypothetical protein
VGFSRFAVMVCTPSHWSTGVPTATGYRMACPGSSTKYRFRSRLTITIEPLAYFSSIAAFSGCGILTLAGFAARRARGGGAKYG